MTASTPALFEFDCLGGGGCRAEHPASDALKQIHGLSLRQTEMEAHHGGLQLQKQCQLFRAERHQRFAGIRRYLHQPCPVEKWFEADAGGFDDLRFIDRVRVCKEIQIEWPVGQPAQTQNILLDGFHRRFRVTHGPQGASMADRSNQLYRGGPRHGCLDDGVINSKQVGQSAIRPRRILPFRHVVTGCSAL